MKYRERFQQFPVGECAIMQTNTKRCKKENALILSRAPISPRCLCDSSLHMQRQWIANSTRRTSWTARHEPISFLCDAKTRFRPRTCSQSDSPSRSNIFIVRRHFSNKAYANGKPMSREITERETRTCVAARCMLRVACCVLHIACCVRVFVYTAYECFNENVVYNLTLPTL